MGVMYRVSSDRWIEFNDTQVREVDMNADYLKRVAYGKKGEEASSFGQNAYMILYERTAMFSEERVKVDALRDTLLANNHLMIQSLHQSNTMMVRHSEIYQHKNARRILISPEYADFMVRIVESTQAEDFYKPEDTSVCDAALSYFILILVRMRDTSKSIGLCDAIQKKFKGRKDLVRWVVKKIVSKEFVNEFLIECPINNVKKMVCSLITAAVEALGLEESERGGREVEERDVVLLNGLSQTVYSCLCECDHEGYVKKYGLWVIEYLSRIGPVAAYMGGEDYPENLLNMIGMEFILDLGSVNMPRNAETPDDWRYDYIGYKRPKESFQYSTLNNNQDALDMTAEEISLDYSAAVVAVINILRVSKKNQKALKALLFSSDNYWISLIFICKSNRARLVLSRYLFENLSTKDDKEKRRIFNHILPDFAIKHVRYRSEMKTLLCIYQTFISHDTPDVGCY